MRIETPTPEPVSSVEAKAPLTISEILKSKAGKTLLVGTTAVSAFLFGVGIPRIIEATMPRPTNVDVRYDVTCLDVDKPATGQPVVQGVFVEKGPGSGFAQRGSGSQVEAHFTSSANHPVEVRVGCGTQELPTGEWDKSYTAVRVLPQINLAHFAITCGNLGKDYAANECQVQAKP